MNLSKLGMLNLDSDGRMPPGNTSSIKMIRVQMIAGNRLVNIFLSVCISIGWNEDKTLSGYFSHHIYRIHVGRFTAAFFLQRNGKSLGAGNGL